MGQKSKKTEKRHSVLMMSMLMTVLALPKQVKQLM